MISDTPSDCNWNSLARVRACWPLSVLKRERSYNIWLPSRPRLREVVVLEMSPVTGGCVGSDWKVAGPAFLLRRKVAVPLICGSIAARACTAPSRVASWRDSAAAYCGSLLRAFV